MNRTWPPSQESTRDHDSENVVEQKENTGLAADKTSDSMNPPSTNPHALDAGHLVVYKKDFGVLVDGTVNPTNDSGSNSHEASGAKEDSPLATANVVDLAEPGTPDTRGVVDHKDDCGATVSDAVGLTRWLNVAFDNLVDSNESHDLGAWYSRGSPDHKDDAISRQFPISHPRSTSRLTNVQGGNHGLENSEYCEEGGYHPVHLSNHIGPNNHYPVIHKLGQRLVRYGLALWRHS